MILDELSKLVAALGLEPFGTDSSVLGADIFNTAQIGSPWLEYCRNFRRGLGTWWRFRGCLLAFALPGFWLHKGP